MTAPRHTIAQMPYRNPHSTSPLFLTVIVVANTSDEDLARNIKINSERDLPWLSMAVPHGGIAVMVGGGPSAEDHLPKIRALQEAGATIYAMNAASQWLRGHGIEPSFQVMADAKPETATLVDQEAQAHLFASQVNPLTMDAVERPTVWHLAVGEFEHLFPETRRKRGGYAMIGGGAAVGNSALCVAYAMGFRRFEIFGFDSSHRGEASHAYEQPMNQFIPCVDVVWAGKTYHCSVAMKAQAERFQITGRDLLGAGCSLTVHGDGLLPAMWDTPPEALSEQDKYRLMWQFDSYREFAPGEHCVDTFLEKVKPSGLIVDFGSGTGRAALALADKGHDVLLVDFADNSRDQEAIRLPFLEWDLTRPLELRAPYGLCCDVLEHIPTDDVETVISNIMEAAETVFFQIATEPDRCGGIIHQPLHLTVRSAGWWIARFARYSIDWIEVGETSVQMIVSNRRAS